MVKVALSRRNLKALLAKLDGHPPGSAKTLSYPMANGDVLWVTAEEDDAHYSHPEREAPAGAMHPETETRL